MLHSVFICPRSLPDIKYRVCYLAMRHNTLHLRLVMVGNHEVIENTKEYGIIMIMAGQRIKNDTN